MAKTIDSSSKVAYIYNSTTDKWHPIAGTVNTAAPYTWSGEQSFTSTTTFDQVLKAKAGVNNFLNATQRDAAFANISSENKRGIVCFIRVDSSGLPLNDLQFFDGTSWRSYGDSAILLTKTNTPSYTISLADAGRTILALSDTVNEIVIPADSTVSFAIGQRLDIIRYGAGATSISAVQGVTINSKNSNKKIAAQFSGATLIKTNANTWTLIGDLTA